MHADWLKIVFLSSYRNMSGSLGEPEMLWEPVYGQIKHFVNL